MINSSNLIKIDNEIGNHAKQTPLNNKNTFNEFTHQRVNIKDNM